MRKKTFQLSISGYLELKREPTLFQVMDIFQKLVSGGKWRLGTDEIQLAFVSFLFRVKHRIKSFIDLYLDGGC